MVAEKSTLLVVDVQERLLPHIHGWQALLEHIVWLVRVAQKLEVPVMVTEQYPKGLGHTDTRITSLVSPGSVAEKIDFSCVSSGCLPRLIGSEREQIIVCGIESHVCVLQTVLELREQGKQVFVVADSVGSRNPENKALAIERMRGRGVEIVAREMVAFEWLRRAGTSLFREVSKEFLR